MTCHFCGGETPCDCTTDCGHCPHIGHEHYADGRCRGTVYFDGPMHVEDCLDHQYEPVSVSSHE